MYYEMLEKFEATATELFGRIGDGSGVQFEVILYDKFNLLVRHRRAQTNAKTASRKPQALGCQLKEISVGASAVPRRMLGR